VKWIALMSVLSASIAAASPDPAIYGPALASEVVEGSGGCCAVEVAGDYLYAAGAESLAVFEIKTDPAKPRLVAEMKGVKGCRQMAICGDKAYITARNYGLWIVDIANPLEPTLIRQFDTIELATGIAATENVIFVAHRVYGVQILDVTDPRFPRHISQVRTAEAQSVVYRDGMLYIGDWGVGKLTIVDVHDLRQPKVVAQGILDGFGDGVFLKDNLCFCSTGHDAKSGPKEDRPGNGRGVEIFDVSDGQNPQKLGVFKFPRFLRRDNDYWTSRVCGNTLFCVDSHNGFYMIDVSDPANMKGIGHLQLPPPVYRWKVPEDRRLSNDCCASLATGDGVVYIAGLTTGIHVVRVPAAYKQPLPELRLDIPAAPPEVVDPRLWRYDLHCQVRRVAVKDDFAYVAASHDGLKLFGIGPDGLKELRTWERECVYDVSVLGDTLFVAENNVDLAVYRIAADGDLAEIARGQLPGGQGIQIVHPFLGGKYLAVSGGTGRCTILDATNPAEMKEVYGGGCGGILYGDMFPTRDLNGLFPINWHSRGIAWYDLNGAKPTVTSTGNPPQGSQLDGLDLLDSGLFVFPERGTRLALIDPKSPGEPKTVEVKDKVADMPIRGIPSVCGNLVVFASRRDGKVVTLDLSAPESPVVIKDRCYDLSQGNCDRVAFHKGKMIIPAGHYGLFMEK
jgi:hypothetical protein